MAKDPAFLFYSSDFLTGVSDLNMEERGQYITLLSLQHQKGFLTEKMIQLVVGKISDDVRKKFTKTQDGIFNEQLKSVIEKRAKHSAKQVENVSKRWKNKETEKKDDTKPIPNQYQKDTKKIPLENEIENVNTIVIENGVEKYLFLINSLLGKKFRATEKVKSAFQARTKDGYTMDDFRQAIENARTDQFHIDNDLKYLDSMFFLRQDKLEKWLCAKSSLPKAKSAEPQKGTMSKAIAMGDNYFKKREEEIQESKKIAG